MVDDTWEAQGLTWPGKRHLLDGLELHVFVPVANARLVGVARPSLHLLRRILHLLLSFARYLKVWSGTGVLVGSAVLPLFLFVQKFIN